MLSAALQFLHERLSDAIVVLGEPPIEPDCAISGHKTHKFAEGGRRPA
jgi:hypothetical protein